MISVCGSAGKRGMRHYQREPPHQPCTVARQARKRLADYSCTLLYQG